jgi:hypothetical protein
MPLSSAYELLAVVVSGAIRCRSPVAASDRLGVTADLIDPVDHDFFFTCGEVPTLTELLQQALSDLTQLIKRPELTSKHKVLVRSGEYQRWLEAT